MKYVDVHGHVNFSAYADDREEVIRRAADAGVGMITVGTQMDTSRAALDLARSHPMMYATVGLHPTHTQVSHHDEDELGPEGKAFTSRGEKPDAAAYLEMAADPKAVAVGECGLDYFHYDDSMLALQEKAFEAMIDVANEAGKPLMLHIRNGSGKSAYRDALAILKNRSKVRGNLHFFAGSVEEARPFLDLGYTFSFTGVVTFARNYDEVVRFLPQDRIMSETDCPYVTPVPYRGKRNEPIYVTEVVSKLAEIRGEVETLLNEQILKNARDLFGIS